MQCIYRNIEETWRFDITKSSFVVQLQISIDKSCYFLLFLFSMREYLLSYFMQYYYYGTASIHVACDSRHHQYIFSYTDTPNNGQYIVSCHYTYYLFYFFTLTTLFASKWPTVSMQRKIEEIMDTANRRPFS